MAVKRYVLAVSGGVDSVVLLHKMKQLRNVSIVVAHFDHGIRPESADDALFVKQLAHHYALPFETRREDLGAGASEATARERRYRFLKEVARHYDAPLVTAHHADDAIETVAINHLRGTGWRGLAPMSDQILRPLLTETKSKLLAYAKDHQLEWREDSTNHTDAYLRNRVRQRLAAVSVEHKKQLLELFHSQRALRQKIEQEIQALLPDSQEVSRYFFIHIHPIVGLELLRSLTSGALTRPQLERALLMIKTAKPGAIYQAGKGIEFLFTTRHFSVKLIK